MLVKLLLLVVAAAGLLQPGLSSPKFAFLHSNVLLDGTFNEAILDGAKEAFASGADFTYKFFYIPTAPEEPDLVIATIRNLTAMQGYTHVVFSGFEFQEAVQRVGDVPTWSSGLASPSFDPYSVRFSLLDTRLPHEFDNLQYVVFKDDDVSFAAGLLAGKLAQTMNQSLAVACGMPYEPVRRLCNGFREGVRHICPNCTTEGFYLNTFDDGPVPRLMSSYFDSHLRPDVVFGAAGQAGGAVINRSAIDGTLVVGVDTDEYVTLFQSGNRTGSDRILTSAMKSLANAVKAVVYADIDGDFRGGRTWTFDFSNAGIVLAPCHETCEVWGHLESWMRDQELQIANNVLKTGLNPSGVVRREYADNNGWTTLDSFSRPPVPRKGQGCPGLGSTWWDQSLFSFAGFTGGGVTADVFAYDLVDLSWRPVTPLANLQRVYPNGSTSLALGIMANSDVLPPPRVYPCTVQHPDGVMVLFGGLSADSAQGRAPLGDVWVLTKSKLDNGHNINSIMEMAALHSSCPPRFQHSAVSVDGTMVVFGGRVSSGERVNDVWKHEVTGPHPDNHTWTELIPVDTSNSAAIPRGRSLCTMVAFGAYMYIAGGQVSTDVATAIAADTWRLSTECLHNTTRCVWERLADLPDARYAHVMLHMFLASSVSGAAPGAGADVLVVHGGLDTHDTVLNTVTIFNITAGEWRPYSSFGGPALIEHCAVAYDGQIIVFGGMRANYELSNTVWAYNFAVENLCELAGLAGCSGHGVCEQSTGVAVCKCDPAYDGSMCGVCAAGHFVDESNACAQRVTQEVDISTTVAIILTALAGLQALVYVGAGCAFFRFRNEYAIKASSPPFLMLMCTAGVGSCAAAATLAMPTTLFAGMCIVRTWSLVMFGVVMVAAVFTRTYRLHKLFNNKSLRQVRVTDSFLWKVVGVNVGIAAAILAAWTAADPPVLEYKVLKVSTTLHERRAVCSESPAFETLIGLYMLGLMLWGCNLAFRTRKLPSVFNESKYLGVAVYASLFAAAISVPLLYLLRDNQDAASVVRSVSVQLTTLVALVAVLLSKLALRKKHNAEASAKKAVAAQQRGKAEVDFEVVERLQKANRQLGKENKELRIQVERLRLELKHTRGLLQRQGGAGHSIELSAIQAGDSPRPEGRDVVNPLLKAGR